MIRWLLVLVLTLGSTTFALTYSEALEAVGQRPPVQSARAELVDAQDQLQRVQSDPEAVRLDRLQAQQRVELARAELRLERVRAAAEITRAYTQLLDAEAAYNVALLARDLAERNAKIARLRYAKGGISLQTLRDAELQLDDAKNTVRKSAEGRSLARTQLASLIGVSGRFEHLEPPGEPIVPSLNTIYLSLDEHPDRLRLQHAVELAENALALLDPSYAPRAQIEKAELQLSKARDGLDEVVRGLQLQAKQRWQNTAKMLRARDLARARMNKAKHDYKIAQERYAAGLISEIALLQAKLMREQAILDAQMAEHAYLNAAWDLAIAIAQPLEVNHAP